MLFLLVSIISGISFAEEIKTSTMSGLERYDNYNEQQKLHCRELKDGESRVVTGSAPFNKLAGVRADIKMSYVLKRINAKKYRVHLPVFFRNGASYDDPKAERLPSELDKFFRTDRQMRSRVQACLKKENPKLRDKDGVQIELSIDATLRESTTHGLDAVEITIEGEEYRSNKIAYESDIDCPTIVHELLHLTGLCDEYHENTAIDGVKKNRKGEPLDPQAIGFENKPDVTTKFDCRAVPPSNSIMGNQIHALAEAKKKKQEPPGPRYEIFQVCDCATLCDMSTADHRKYESRYILSETPVACPKGTAARTLDTDIMPFSQDELADIKGFMGDDNDIYVLRKYKPPPPDYPLRKAHTSHIRFPGCDQKNKKYYECSRSAYETSVNEGCSEASQRCKDDPSWSE